MASPDKTPQRVGICWVDAETFWWDATNNPLCPVCPDVDDGQHGFFVAEAVVVRLREALRGLMDCVHTDEEGNLGADFADWAEPWSNAVAALGVSPDKPPEPLEEP